MINNYPTKAQVADVVTKSLKKQTEYNRQIFSAGNSDATGALHFVGTVKSYSSLANIASINDGSMYKIEEASANNNANDFAFYLSSNWHIISGSISTTNLLTKNDIWLE